MRAHSRTFIHIERMRDGQLTSIGKWIGVKRLAQMLHTIYLVFKVRKLYLLYAACTHTHPYMYKLHLGLRVLLHLELYNSIPEVFFG